MIEKTSDFNISQGEMISALLLRSTHLSVPDMYCVVSVEILQRSIIRCLHLWELLYLFSGDSFIYTIVKVSQKKSPSSQIRSRLIIDGNLE